ncbi:MAG: site-specific DNA-methyltransferase [Elusimicrobia bacterium]|nr:site-specific DNA-methyltransferase [Elusimicrobiota bacterium]
MKYTSKKNNFFTNKKSVFLVNEDASSYNTKKTSFLYYHDPSFNIRLFKGDSLNILAKANPESVDMIFADPPYFLSNNGISCHAGKMVSVNKGYWDKSMGVIGNYEFVKKWLALCQRVLKKDGTIWVSGTSHIIYSIGFAMQELGFKILNDIIWYKINPPPNLSCRYFTHSTEIIIWATKDKNSHHFFNYKLMKTINNGKQMKNLWSIMPPTKDEKKFGKHPTQKPITLLDRIIKASTKDGDLVLDPFCGSSTTGVAALMNNRKYIGIDMSEEYLSLSVKRLEEAMKLKYNEESLFKKG